jgi:hypothetical protein
MAVYVPSHCTGSNSLLCLDRNQRLIFALGEILGVSNAVGAEVLEMTPENFRQCLTGARRDRHSFMNNTGTLSATKKDSWHLPQVLYSA